MYYRCLRRINFHPPPITCITSLSTYYFSTYCYCTHVYFIADNVAIYQMHPERGGSKNSRRIQLARRRASMSSQTYSSVKFAMVLKHDLQVVSSSLNESVSFGSLWRNWWPLHLIPNEHWPTQGSVLRFYVN